MKDYKDLIPLSDYVLENTEVITVGQRGTLEKIINYTQFLIQPLKLSMFIPCDENEKPIILDTEHKQVSESWSPDEIEQYQKALDKVIFEGFEIEKGLNTHSYRLYLKGILKTVYTNSVGFIWTYKTIEDLTNLGLKAKY